MALRTRPRPRAGRLVAAGAAAALTVLSLGVPARAATAPPPTAAAKAAAATEHPAHRVCSRSDVPGRASCSALERDDVSQSRAQLAADPDAAPSGYGPGDLQAAYHLPAGRGSDQTVAIVDAYDNPHAEAELGAYRAQFGLPECTTANGCFTKTDEYGGTDYPTADSGWGAEIALDIQMVSAVCPNCRILLVEAASASMADLGTAVNQAVTQGAKFVSNSYGGGESPAETTYDSLYFRHPGVAITASSGDDGYGVSYPASSPYVTAVGGTSLTADSSTRGWAETAWSGAGSGCSANEAKPSVQTDSGCTKRTVADVSAVANPSTGVAVYNAGAWHVYGGTSVSSPIIASVYALAGTPPSGSAPMTFPYADPSALNDVTSGSNGTCAVSYLCHGGAGYDGPSGLGTPNGVDAFASGPHAVVKGTVTDASTGEPLPGARITAGTATALSGADGTYEMTAPPGPYDITVAKFGYRTKTDAGVTLTDGQTYTEDAALAPKDRVTVSGTVTDGSGHGYPLYATVQVRNEPTSAVHTDPATGKYTLSVPTDDTYTLQADAAYPGYLQAAADVSVGSGDTSRDIGVKVDDTSCTAAGYSYHLDGTTQDFSSATGATPPDGWTVTDALGNGQTWRFDNPSQRTNTTGGTTQFAVADSQYYGATGRQDTSLVSPVYDFSTSTRPYLSFHTDFYAYTGGVANVDLSVDGGQSWTTLAHWTYTRYGPESDTFAMPQAVGHSQVRVRFHYTGANNRYWALDNVFFGDRPCAPDPGGLVLGQVTDKNTGSGIANATVTSTDKPAEQATTAATPDDARLGDGFYWYFSSLLGSHPLKATAARYTPATATPDLVADAANENNLALAAGRITVSTDQISKTVGWHGSAATDVTVHNTGTADATVKLLERDKGFTVQSRDAGAKAVEINGDFRPTFLDPAAGTIPATPPATPSAPPWTALANLPSALMDNAVATAGNGKVYSVGGSSATSIVSHAYVYDPEKTAWTALADPGTAREAAQAAVLDGKLYVTGGWGAAGSALTSTQIYDPSSNSWSKGPAIPKGFAGAASAVLDGRWYLVGGCTSSCGASTVQVFDPTTNAWSSAADYPLAVSWLGCGGIGSQLYCAGGDTGTTSTAKGYSYDPPSDTWSPIADMPFDLWAMGYTGANGKLLLSGGVTNGTSTLTNKGTAYDPSTDTWTDLPNSNNTVYRAGSACGLYKVGGSSGSYNPVNSSELLPGYGDCSTAVDVPWLSETPAALTLAPGESATVTVALDASVTDVNQPGSYAAQVAVGTDTPYGAGPIAVDLTVQPPKTWGKITGTVLGAPCTGGTLALQGATVQIDSAAQSVSLKTEADGRYALWLDYRSGPLTVTAAKDGWAPKPATSKIVKASTTTLDFTLKPDHVCTS